MWHCNEFRTEGLGVIIAGDFNLTEEELRSATEGYYVSRNVGPTRLGANANRAIDHFISTQPMSGLTKLSSESKSDHIPIMTKIKMKAQVKPTPM